MDTQLTHDNMVLTKPQLTEDFADINNSINNYIQSLDIAGKQQLSDELINRYRFAIAMLTSALERRESRGAHTREDYPDTLEEYRRTSVIKWSGNHLDYMFSTAGMK